MRRIRHRLTFVDFYRENVCLYISRTEIDSSSNFRRHLQICRTNPRLQHYQKEWVLRGDTVLYVSASDLRKAIEYDLEQERQFDYSKLDRNGLVSHIAKFVSGLWQIHPFGEGNTRTTAVFTILYLRSMGFDVTNDLFAKHSWYFRNALVRANYQNLQKASCVIPNIWSASFVIFYWVKRMNCGIDIWWLMLRETDCRTSTAKSTVQLPNDLLYK